MIFRLMLGMLLQFVQEKFPDHGVLGEEGGIMGEMSTSMPWTLDYRLSICLLHLFASSTSSFSEACLMRSSQSERPGICFSLAVA